MKNTMWGLTASEIGAHRATNAVRELAMVPLPILPPFLQVKSSQENSYSSPHDFCFWNFAQFTGLPSVELARSYLAVVASSTMAAMDAVAVANAEVQYYYAAQLYHTAQITARAAVR